MRNVIQVFTEHLTSSELRKVDFKSEQYRLDNDVLKSRFIKDILCMANAAGDDGYILLGVKSEKGRPRAVIGISHHHDSSDLEAIVNGVIDAPIQFEYHPLKYRGHDCALLHIPSSKVRPHWPERDFGELKKHIFYTRRASGNREASMPEIQEMFLSSIRISHIAQRKAKVSPHIIDELADLSLDDRKAAMYQMLEHIATKAGLSDYRLVAYTFFRPPRQICALVKSTSRQQTAEYAILMYPWNAKGDNIICSRNTIIGLIEVSRGIRISPSTKARLEQSSLVHISYRNIYTTALERRPYMPSGEYRFANEWNESWGKVMKWESTPPYFEDDKIVYTKKTKYEFFLPNVTSQAELKERLEQLLLWVDNNIN